MCSCRRRGGPAVRQAPRHRTPRISATSAVSELMATTGVDTRAGRHRLRRLGVRRLAARPAGAAARRHLGPARLHRRKCLCQRRFGGQPGLAGGGVRARPTCAIAFGAENLSSFGGGTLPLTTNDIEIDQGMVMPAAYAMRAQRYLHDWGAAVDDLDRVSVKNRRNGADNPRAHFQRRSASEDVDDSRPVADPLRLLHCCPNSDGAAAVCCARRRWPLELRRPARARRAPAWCGPASSRPGIAT